MNSVFRKSVLSVAVLASGAFTGSAIAAQASADPMTPSQPTQVQSVPASADQPPPPPAPPPAPPPEDGQRVLHYDYQRQPNSYYCAPAATRIALSTQGKVVSQREVADKLGTTADGTDSVDATTRVLNDMTAGGYETTEIQGAEADPQQEAELRNNVVEAVDANRGVVANIMGTAVDTEGHRYSYEGGHYLSVVGYRDGGETMKIADPYDPTKSYWMTDDKLADWIAARGYSS
ncbi:Peptidase_C39 like family protein [Micromonospora purpureochromogenes]|uniref:Peptidase_C39 like family protein n=1 Tax=Micromonospora purpureochromogenes TaxID=47872 RepID=A0A1C4YVV2_9ACTN|nr:C39 family peptidase [Micromonospora purpureochromogenes]SCF24804.1 Peptidase_C39 like family protein [Micromonospora purpureochromogenes]